MGKITQDGRLMAIQTPLGKDFLLIKNLRVKEDISKLFKMDIDVVHEEKPGSTKPQHVDPKSILGQSVTVLIQQPDDNKTHRTFNGIVNSFSLLGRDQNFTHYNLEVVPQLWKLTQMRQSQIFQNMTVPGILKKLFEGLEVVWATQGRFYPRNYCVQYRETDFAFASRIMEEEGIFYFFEHEGGKHKLVVANTDQSHPKCPSKSTIPFVHKTEGEGNVPSIVQWDDDHILRSGKVTFWDHKFELPGKHLEADKPSINNIADNLQWELYDFPGGYARKYDGIDPGGGERPVDLQEIFTDNKKTANTAMEIIDSRYKVSYGEGYCCSMTAGHKFKFTEHPGKDTNGQYVITSIFHNISQSPDYQSESVLDAPYENKFRCIKQGQGAPTFRAEQKTPKPIVYGSQTAIVVGPAGEEIFTDKYGRVKVQFHWDRDGGGDQRSSCWLRVAQIWAGNAWGSMFIPRVGFEVVVSFLEGDPDQPIIIGSVYNAANMPHYEMPKFKSVSGIKSRSYPYDGKGYNEFRIEDRAGAEQVFIRSQKRMDVRVRGSLYETCGGNRNEVIGLKQENEPGGNLAVTVAGNYDLHVKENMYIGIDKDLNEVIKGEVVREYKKNSATFVTGKSEFNAKSIIFEASASISLKVGGSAVVIDPSGVTIVGPTVRINSGGSGTPVATGSITDVIDAIVSDNGSPGNLEKRAVAAERKWRKLKPGNSVAPPRKGEDPRVTEIRGILANSEEGRRALEIYDRYGVEPTFREGEGSTFDSDTNTVNLDPNEDPTTSALTFVHEMQHAQEHNERTSGDIHNDSRDEYVNEMLQEEVDGTVRSIEARNELAENGTDVSDAHFPLEQEYQEAHDQAIADARAADPDISDADAEAIGKEAGRQRVEDGFNNGEVVTSNTDQTYPDYYGNAWDGVHPDGI
ncbi:MAG: type VI secretion system tip protein TssI/VgrG [Pyrinomonadaceae bacterium]